MTEKEREKEKTKKKKKKQKKKKRRKGKCNVFLRIQKHCRPMDKGNMNAYGHSARKEESEDFEMLSRVNY